jgi:hypothetical protein
MKASLLDGTTCSRPTNGHGNDRDDINRAKSIALWMWISMEVHRGMTTARRIRATTSTWRELRARVMWGSCRVDPALNECEGIFKTRRFTGSECWNSNIPPEHSVVV